jgi:hypothetical protein
MFGQKWMKEKKCGDGECLFVQVEQHQNPEKQEKEGDRDIESNFLKCQREN